MTNWINPAVKEQVEQLIISTSSGDTDIRYYTESEIDGAIRGKGILHRLWEEHHGDDIDGWPISRMEYTSQAKRAAGNKPLEYAPCCDDPQPRIGEQSGRIFCASCRRYLDSKLEQGAPPEDDDEDDDDSPDGG